MSHKGFWENLFTFFTVNIISQFLFAKNPPEMLLYFSVKTIYSFSQYIDNNLQLTDFYSSFSEYVISCVL